MNQAFFLGYPSFIPTCRSYCNLLEADPCFISQVHEIPRNIFSQRSMKRKTRIFCGYLPIDVFTKTRDSSNTLCALPIRAVRWPRIGGEAAKICKHVPYVPSVAVHKWFPDFDKKLGFLQFPLLIARVLKLTKAYQSLSVSLCALCAL